MQTIKLDLQRQSILTPLKAKQNDRYSRFFKLELWDNSTEFQLPEGAVFTLRYVVPSGCGWYDAITEIDGKKTHSAFSVDGSSITIELAEAVLTKPGRGAVSLQIHTVAGYRIGSWNIPIEIEEDPCSDQNIVASDYYNVLTAQVALTLQYRNAAEKAATAAAQSAENASNKAVDANNSAGAADTSAKAAKTSETNAAASASTATTKATAADASAKAAKTSETNAAASANTATTKATAADTSAKAAKTSETNAAASASTAGASATAAAESAAAAAESAKQTTVPGRNIGDNTDFTDLVNQRIATTYTAPTSTSVMTIDRWGIITGQLEIVNGAIILTPGTMFFQNINPIEVVESEAHTLSIEFDNGKRYSVTGTFLPFSEITTPYGKLGLYKGTYPQIAFTASVRCGIKNIKIEKGQVATPYVKKGRAAEAAECKRYYRDMVVNASRVSGNMFSVSQTIDMRTAPTYTMMAFSPYGATNVTNFAGCSMEVTKEFITYANLPTCAAHVCGGLRVLLNADLL